MSETLALFRLAINKDRWYATLFLVCVLVGMTTAIVTSRFFLTEESPIPGAIIGLAILATFFPAAVSAVVLFNFNQRVDLMSAESGCSHWLLRMPIASWKIAFAPVLLKTAWICTLWVLLVITLRQLGAPSTLPVLTPAMAISSIAVWMLVIGWRPFSRQWWRLFWLTLLLPVLYFCVYESFVPMESPQLISSAAAHLLAFIVAATAYIGGAWAAVRAVEFARTNAAGFIPAWSTDDRAPSTETAASPEIRFANVRRALCWHDLGQSNTLIRGTILLGVVPGFVILGFFLPFGLASLVFALVLFGYLGAFAAGSIGRSDYRGGTAMLPPYLAASPLRTSTIAWSRLLLRVAVHLAVTSCLLFVFLAWACSSENREVWMSWASSRASDAGAPADVMLIGLRWSAAILLVAIVPMVGLMISGIWVGMTGREWVGLVAGLILAVTITLAIILATFWFTGHQTWESFRASALEWMSIFPSMIAIVLLLRVVGVIAVTYSLRQSRLVADSEIARVVLIWAAVVLIAAVTIQQLVPDPRLTLSWSVAITSLALPLARVLVLPLALDWNRHR